MVYDATLFNTKPYYDDFDENKKFLRTLFRPGFAVQARELTQLQTVLQSQIARFGDHIFENGSIISGGQITTTRINYIRTTLSVEESTDSGMTYTTLSGADITSALEAMIGNEIYSSSNNNIRAKVLYTIEKDITNDPHHYIFFDYLSGTGSFSGNDILLVTNRENGNLYRVTVKADSSDNLPNTGTAHLVTTQPGIYYVDGFFILTDAQRIVPYNLATESNNSDGGTTVATGARMFANPTSSVGFNVVETLVTSETDTSLTDTAYGSTNYAAPGADRYKVELILASNEYYVPSGSNETISDISNTDFFEILRYNSGVVTKKEVFPQYAELEKTLARRTYDESGNYTVVPFDLEMREHLDDGAGNGGVYTEANGGDKTKLSAAIGPGKAYVRGLLYENIATQFVSVDKARTTDSLQQVLIENTIGNYILLATTALSTGFDIGATVLHSEDHPSVVLKDSIGATVATARFRQIQLDDDTLNRYKFFMYDIGLISGASLSDTFSVHASGGATIGFVDNVVGINSNGTKWFNTTPDTLLFKLPVDHSVSSVSLTDHEVQLTFTAIGASGTAVFSAPSLSGDPIMFKDVSNAPFNHDLFIINTTTNTFLDDYTGVTAGLDATRTTLTVYFGTTAYDGHSLKLIANMDVEPTSSEFSTLRRTKTLNASQTVAGITLLYDSELGQTYANLGFPDVYAVESVVGTNTGNNYNLEFKLDDGQRDNMYDLAKIIAIVGASLAISDTKVDVTFRRFTHTGQYGPFTVDSYPVGTEISGFTFGYENIPSFTSEKTGETVSLRDVLDYRPVVASDGSVSNAFIPTTANFLVDFSYYLPRIDKLVLDSNRDFRIIKGVPSANPSIPADDPNAMTMYVIKLGSYTFGPEDVESRYIDNKRFVMRDIGKLEDRIDQLEFYSSLSLLEQEANSLTFTDSSGTVIPKTGILVDDFNGHEIGDVTNRDYACSMSFEDGLLRPAFDTSRVKFSVKSIDGNITAHKTKAEKKATGSIGDDNILYTLSYNQVRAINSILPNTTINPNPTGKLDWYGNLYITPGSDDWYNTSKRPTVKLNRVGANDAWEFRPGNYDLVPNGFGTQWKDWEINWFGTEIIDQEINRNAEFVLSRRVFDATFDGITASNSIRDEDHETSLLKKISGIAMGGKYRNSISKKIIPDTIMKKLSDKTVNTTVQPYNKSTTIRFWADSLKPNTSFYVFVDNIQVGTAVSDENGELTGVGTIDLSNVTDANINIKTGDRLIRLIDVPSNDVTQATSVAERIFRGRGLVETYKDGIQSTKAPISRRISGDNESIINDLFVRGTIDGSKPIGLDNLAQNFTVDKTKYNRGIFASSIDLLINRIPNSTANDNDSNLPINIEIRQAVNGYPHPSRIIPGSIVSMLPSEVNEAGTKTDINDSTVRTRFTFDYPVYLAPGEYSIVIRTNSDRYLLYTGNIGDQVAIGTDNTGGTGTEKVSRQPFVGALFKPQNAGSVVQDFTEALVFAVNRCEFDTTAPRTIVFRNKANDIPADTTYDAYRLNSTHITFDPADQSTKSLKFEIATTIEGNTTPGQYKEISPNQTLEPASDSTTGRTQKLASVDETVLLRVTMNTDDNTISPVLDAERLSFLGIKNIINESSSEISDKASPNYNGELDPLTPLNDTRVSKSRYITKTITLKDGLESSDIRVFLKVSQPYGTKIQVFARVLKTTDDGKFVDKDYVELIPQSTNNSLTKPYGFTIPSIGYTKENEFVDVQYKAANNASFGDFKVFSVKIVMHSNDQHQVPKCKDLRIITLV